MSQRSSLWRVPSAYAPTISRAFGSAFFCAGVILLPPLLMANLAIWLGCQHLSRSECAGVLSAGLTLLGP